MGLRLTLFCKHSDFISHLQDDVEFWKLQFAHERRRAERAIDQLLMLKASAGPVTVSDPETGEEASKQVLEMLKDEEFQKVGI